MSDFIISALIIIGFMLGILIVGEIWIRIHSHRRLNRLFDSRVRYD
ncbi:MAG: hypothetical protein V3V41_08000 [Candidatus Heimdallarchaeota archaeon]